MDGDRAAMGGEPQWSPLAVGRSVTSAFAQARGALARSASKTGCRSVGERQMTRRISLVAVCCSSASVRSALRAWSSLNRRTFSMAITAWSAKVWSSAICRVGEGPDLRPAEHDRADAARPRAAAGRQRCCEAEAAGELADRRELGFARGVRNVDGPAVEDGTAGARLRGPAENESGKASTESAPGCGRRRDGAAHRRTGRPSRTGRLAEMRGAPGNGLEDRLDIRGGAADHPEDLARRRLLLEGLVEVRVPRSSSGNSRTFSMAITAWSAKVWSRAIWLA